MSVGNGRNCIVCGKQVVTNLRPPYCSHCDPELKRRLTEAKLEALRRKEMWPITPDEYVRLAMRTECEELEPLARMCPLNGDPLLPIRLAHALLGISGEAGELSENVKKWIFYGRPLDRQEMKEELGDLLWYVALACNALGVPLSEVMEANISKLKSRFPEKFTTDRAITRDTVAERQAIQETFEDSMERGG